MMEVLFFQVTSWKNRGEAAVVIRLMGGKITFLYSELMEATAYELVIIHEEERYGV